MILSAGVDANILVIFIVIVLGVNEALHYQNIGVFKIFFVCVFERIPPRLQKYSKNSNIVKRYYNY